MQDLSRGGLVLDHAIGFPRDQAESPRSHSPACRDRAEGKVADDFGRLGRAWREADYEATDLETVLQDLLTGQYSHPIRVDTAERWSEDVSEELPVNYADAAICRCVIFPLRFLILLNGMRIAIGVS